MDGMDIAYRRQVLDALCAEIDYERTTIPLTHEALRLAAEREASRIAGNIPDMAQFVARYPRMLQMTARAIPQDREMSLGAVLRRDARRWMTQDCADIVDDVHVGQFKGRRWALMTSLAELSLGLFENRPDWAGDYPVEAARDRLASLELVEWPDRDGMTILLRGIAAHLESMLRESGENPVLSGDHPDLPATTTVFEAIWDVIELDERDHGAFYSALRDEAAELQSAPTPR
jgi:hypothetical protein